jgi:hypothetical protein
MLWGGVHRRRFKPWHDPKLGYRNEPEYQRQRHEAQTPDEKTAVEERWARRWREKLKFTQKPT